MEILSRLPVKSLTRFRCVCKSWACCFRTSYFITKHHRHNLDNNHIHLLLKRSDYADANVKANAYSNLHRKRMKMKITTTYFSALSTVGKGIGQNFNFVVAENIHIPNLLSDFQVYGPCNGLLYLKDDSGKSVIWNPSTRQFKTIPEFIIRSRLYEALGFGFDSTTDDYKVVRFVTGYNKGSQSWIHTVDLYSLRSDCWKEISDPKTKPMHIIGYQGFNCYVNGFYYWPATIWSPHGAIVILSFDMANEKFSTLPWPNVAVRHGLQRLIDFNGLLGLIYHQGSKDAMSVDLWVMNNGSWSRQLSIKPPVVGVVKPLGFWENGEIFYQSESNNELVLIDPATKEVKNLGVANGLGGAAADFKFRMELIAYVESLVPIN